MKSAIISLQENESVYVLKEWGGRVNSYWTDKNIAEHYKSLFQSNGISSHIEVHQINPKEPPIIVGRKVLVDLSTGERLFNENFQENSNFIVTRHRRPIACVIGITFSDPDLGKQTFRELNGKILLRRAYRRGAIWELATVSAMGESLEHALQLAEEYRQSALERIRNLTPFACEWCLDTEYKDIDSPLTNRMYGKWFCSEDCFDKYENANPGWIDGEEEESSSEYS